MTHSRDQLSAADVQRGMNFLAPENTPMNDITPIEAPARLPVTGEAATLMEVISRAASDPNTDVDKLERLMSLYERMAAHKAEESYHEAMSAAQAEMRPIAADANNPQTKSKYASYHALDQALRPIYTKYGFSLGFDTEPSAIADHLLVICKVHRAGHTERHQIDMPADGKGAKGGDVMTKTHATGAAMSYGQRYLLRGVFNIAVFDDDGTGASAPTQFVNETQRDELLALADEVGADKQKFCAFLKVTSFATIPANQYQRAKALLQAKRGSK